MSLVEILVAVLLVEVGVAAALACAVQSERIRRRAAAGGLTDAARWQAWHGAQRAPSCVAATAPAAWWLALPATVERPAAVAGGPCGR